MKKGIIIMPVQPKYPIDDNTLFILLALRYQGHIEMDGLHSVYDWNVNYDETVLNPEGKNLPVEEIAKRGINWICENFKIKPEVQTSNAISLKVNENSELIKYLDNYFNEFTQYKNYYYSEAKHKERFYNFIKNNFPVLLEFEDKYFTYKFLPKENIEKVRNTFSQRECHS